MAKDMRPYGRDNRRVAAWFAVIRKGSSSQFADGFAVGAHAFGCSLPALSSSRAHFFLDGLVAERRLELGERLCHKLRESRFVERLGRNSSMITISAASFVARSGGCRW